ncbi:MAG: glycosyltransferase family 2 protein [Elusimicrobiota bacterium]
MAISVVVPVYNEVQSVVTLNDEIVNVLNSIKQEYEIIYIDDGSTDSSYDSLKKIAAVNHRVKVIKFTRNFGQSAALSAGVGFAKYEIVVTLDADLQNDPRDIPLLLEKLEYGYDLVSGWRKKRYDPFLTRKLPSVIANIIIRMVTGVKLHDFGCTLKAYRKKFLVNIKIYGEMHRLLPAYLSAYGAKITEVVVNHRSREYGKSKYGLTRTFKVLLDLLTTKFMLGYSSKPSYILGGWGLFLCISGCICGAVVLVNKFMYNIYAYKQPLLWLAMFLGIIGTQFIAFGLLAELVVRMYYSSENKNSYMIDTIISNNDANLQFDFGKTVEVKM